MIESCTKKRMLLGIILLGGLVVIHVSMIVFQYLLHCVRD